MIINVSSLTEQIYIKIIKNTLNFFIFTFFIQNIKSKSYIIQKYIYIPKYLNFKLKITINNRIWCVFLEKMVIKIDLIKLYF